LRAFTSGQPVKFWLPRFRRRPGRERLPGSNSSDVIFTEAAAGSKRKL
jgi:hypothetical protein